MSLGPQFLKNIRSAATCLVILTALFMPQASAQGQNAEKAAAVVAKGEYLAQAGDCVACHTAPGGKLFAGGRAMPTPFGTLYTSNVTPDLDTGIGKWTSDQFYSMMHTGRSPDGGLLYPAMPFGSYTKITRADSDAMFAFMQSVPPVKQSNKPHDLKFPYNNRSLIIGWRTLFFTEGEYKPVTTKSDDWNRGAYLVQGLGHCAMCHTAINALGGSSESAAFEGRRFGAAAERIDRGMAHGAMAETLHEVGAAVPVVGLRRDWLVFAFGEEQRPPADNQRAVIVRKLQVMRLVRLLHRRHGLHEREHRIAVGARDLGIGAERHRRIKQASVRGASGVHHRIELVGGPFTDARVQVGRDVRGI